MLTPSLVMVGAPHFFSSTTLRPRGPRVTLTASARVFMPRSRPRRASSSKAIILAMWVVSSMHGSLHGRAGARDGRHLPAWALRWPTDRCLTVPTMIGTRGPRVPETSLALDPGECKERVRETPARGALSGDQVPLARCQPARPPPNTARPGSREGEPGLG